MNRNAFDNLSLNDNKFQFKVANYLISTKDLSDLPASSHCHALRELNASQQDTRSGVKSPQITSWEYMQKDDVTALINYDKKSKIRNSIESSLKSSYPRGFPRILFRELMYSVVKFCKKSEFDVEQSGAILAMFFLTHSYFISSLQTGPEKLYYYFKELQMCHSLPFPPLCVKLFNLEQVRSVMTFFCRLYLRNLPLIRFLSLPNFAVRAHYKLEPEYNPKKPKKGGKKDKKGKKGKGKGKKK